MVGPARRCSTVASVGWLPDSAAQTYPALFAWGDVLEVRVLLVYLNNPGDLRAISVKGILVDEQGCFSYLIICVRLMRLFSEVPDLVNLPKVADVGRLALSSRRFWC